MLILLSWLDEKSLLEEKLFHLVMQQWMMKIMGSLQLGITEDEVAEEGGPGSGAAEDGTAQVGSMCR